MIPDLSQEPFYQEGAEDNPWYLRARYSSTIFCFLPLFLALYFLTPARGKNLLIAPASYVFYGWWRPDFVILMLISTIVDFSCGKGILRARQHDSRGKAWLWLSLGVNLGLLAYFKYANFGIDTLNALLQPFHLGAVSWTRVILPVGIFSSFPTMSSSSNPSRL